jgi:hypothetical protein
MCLLANVKGVFKPIITKIANFFVLFTFLLISNLSFSAVVSKLTPSNEIKCEVIEPSNITWVNWMSVAHVIYETESTIAIEFYTQYGQCSKDKTLYYKAENPSFGFWNLDPQDPLKYFPKVKIEEATSNKYKITLEISKDKNFRTQEITYLMSFIPSEVEREYFWNLSIIPGDQDTASQVRLSSGL